MMDQLPRSCEQDAMLTRADGLYCHVSLSIVYEPRLPRRLSIKMRNSISSILSPDIDLAVDYGKLFDAVAGRCDVMTPDGDRIYYIPRYAHMGLKLAELKGGYLSVDYSALKTFLLAIEDAKLDTDLERF